MQQQQTTTAETNTVLNVQHVINEVVLRVGSLVESSFGPCGRTNLLYEQTQSGPKLVLIKDACTTLQNEQSTPMPHPVGALITRLVKSISTVAGDGTTSAICLLVALMNEAYSLIVNEGIHAKTIIREYQSLSKTCISMMKERYAVNILEAENVTLDTVVTINESHLVALSRSILETRMDPFQAQNFASVCVKAIQHVYEGKKVKQLRDESVQIYFGSKRGLNTHLEFIDGIVIDQGVRDIQMPRKLSKCKILLITEALELPQRQSALDIQFHTAQQRVDLISAERDVIDKKVDAIVQSGATLVLSSNAIDAAALNRLAHQGIVALRHVKQDILDRVAYYSNAVVVSSIARQLADDNSIFGYAESVRIEEHKQSSNTIITGLPQGRPATLYLQAPTTTILEYNLRSLKNTIKVLQNAYEDCLIIPGGGSVEMALTHQLRSTLDTYSDVVHKRIAESYINALEYAIPGTLCKNSGFNVYQVLDEWRKKNGELTTINLYNYPIEWKDPTSCGIYDSLRVKIQVLHQTVDLISTLLSIDYIVKAEDLRSQIQQQKGLDQQLDDSNEPKSSSWKYNRHYSKLATSQSSWSQHEKEGFKRKEAKFYSKKEANRRKRLDKQAVHLPTSNGNNQQSEEIQRRRRERGEGYNIDPFE